MSVIHRLWAIILQSLIIVDEPVGILSSPGPGTGVPFHIHGATFAETIFGRKVKPPLPAPPPPFPPFISHQCVMQYCKWIVIFSALVAMVSICTKASPQIQPWWHHSPLGNTRPPHSGSRWEAIGMHTESRWCKWNDPKCTYCKSGQSKGHGYADTCSQVICVYTSANCH